MIIRSFTQEFNFAFRCSLSGINIGVLLFLLFWQKEESSPIEANE